MMGLKTTHRIAAVERWSRQLELLLSAQHCRMFESFYLSKSKIANKSSGMLNNKDLQFSAELIRHLEGEALLFLIWRLTVPVILIAAVISHYS